MPRVEVGTHIARPPEEVHDFIQEFDRYPEWIPFTDEVTRVDRTDEVVGTYYEEEGTGGTSRWTVTAFEHGAREEHEGDIGIARVRILMEMAPDDGGTAYRHVIDYEMKVPLLGWLIDKVVFGRTMRRGTHETVANLKRILDDGG